MFACCHPELSQDAQVALVLETVSGLSVREIARALPPVLSTRGELERRAGRLEQAVSSEPLRAFIDRKIEQTGTGLAHPRA